ncbi:MAG: glycosyltransferase [Prolixibacteraceae bacterium]|nr:glycosyltransferase [Prolixibacteraceae bacterium]
MEQILHNRILFILGNIFLGAGFLYFVFIYIRVGFYIFHKKKVNQQISSPHPISVLMIVHNEENRIEKILSELLVQDYSKYEVVVADNFSEDRTCMILSSLSEKYSNLHFTSINQNIYFSDKQSVNLALKAAKYEWVVFVSTDVVHIPITFLKEINKEINGSSSFYINYSNYLPKKGKYNRICRMERFFSFINSVTYSAFNISFFTQRNNVLFVKNKYFDTKPFRGKMNRYNADIELLYNCHGQGRQILLNEYSGATSIREKESLSKDDFYELFRKKIILRKEYGFFKKFFMRSGTISFLLMLLGFTVILFLRPDIWYYELIPFVLLFILYIVKLEILGKRLNEIKIVLPSLVYIFVRPIVLIYYCFLSFFYYRHNR